MTDTDKGEHEEGDEDPWTYRGRRLLALNFPLGGFGTGNILLQGDGTLQGWTIMNNFHNPEYTPLHKLPGNIFALTAKWDDDPGATISNNAIRTETIVLQSPENYSVQNQNIHHREERHVSQHQVERTKIMQKDNMNQDKDRDGCTFDRDGSKCSYGSSVYVKNVEMKCQYPIAKVRYQMTSPNFPVDVELEALTPLIPNATEESSYPLAVFTFKKSRTRSKTKTMDRQCRSISCNRQ